MSDNLNRIIELAEEIKDIAEKNILQIIRKI